jgi:hypothetical protein
MYACMCTPVYICVCVCVYIYIYTHTHIHIYIRGRGHDIEAVWSRHDALRQYTGSVCMCDWACMYVFVHFCEYIHVHIYLSVKQYTSIPGSSFISIALLSSSVTGINSPPYATACTRFYGVCMCICMYVCLQTCIRSFFVAEVTSLSYAKTWAQCLNVYVHTCTGIYYVNRTKLPSLHAKLICTAYMNKVSQVCI